MRGRGTELLGWATVLLVGCAEGDVTARAPAAITLSPPMVDFGDVALGRARKSWLTLTNTGRAPQEIGELVTLGPDGFFQASWEDGAPGVLDPGESRGVSVFLRPAYVGFVEGRIRVTSVGPGEPPSEALLRGQAVAAAVVLGASELEFGRIEVGEVETRAMTLSNPSRLPVAYEIEPVGVNRAEFLIKSKGMLSPDETRSIDVTFRPLVAGRKLAALAVSPCAGCGDDIVALHAVGLDQSIRVDPPRLNLGQVVIDRAATRTVKVVNESTRTRKILSVSLGDTSDPSFRLDSSGGSFDLAGDGQRELSLTFRPGHLGPASGLLTVQSATARHPKAEIEVTGAGGAPELCVVPAAVDFSGKPVGAKVSASVRVSNCGSEGTGRLRVTGVTLLEAAGAASTGVDQFVLERPALPLELEVGEGTNLKVFFEPTRAGPASASLRLDSNAPGSGPGIVPLSGEGSPTGPCHIAITPTAVDFGTVGIGRGAVLGIKIQNAGTAICALKNLRLSASTPGVFGLPGGALDGIVVEPGSAFSFMVSFRAHSGPADYRGAVEFEKSDPAEPISRVAISARADDACLVPQPPFLDFGIRREGCPAPPLSAVVENRCGVPVVVQRVWIAPGTTDGEFEILPGLSPTPLSLLPGQQVVANVSYRGQVVGMNLSPLWVSATGLVVPLLVPLLGETVRGGSVSESFVQPDPEQVDLFLVVDNTASMVEEHPRLRAAVLALERAVTSRGLSVRVAVTTTGIDPASPACPGGAWGGEAGRLFPVDHTSDRILDVGQPGFARRLERSLGVGQCAFVEQGLEAARRALTVPLVDHADAPGTAALGDGNRGFLRDAAALSVVFVSDEDDHSMGTVEEYARALAATKPALPPGGVAAFAIAPNGVPCAGASASRSRYAELVSRMGGTVASVCEGDYGPLLAAAASRPVDVRRSFPLRERPDASGLAVSVNGILISGGFAYDPVGNRVTFTQAPAPASKIVVTYRPACAP